MLILLRTQVERTDKTPVTACCARVGGLCRFRSPAERVPAGSLKIGRCAGVRECWRKMLILARTAVGKAACDKREHAETGKIEGFCTLRRESRTKPRGRARPAVSSIPAVRAVSGIYEGVPKGAKISHGVLQNEKARRFKEYSGVPTKNTR